MIRLYALENFYPQPLSVNFLQTAGISNQWVDVRDIFATDDQFRAANINWEITGTHIMEQIIPLFETQRLYLPRVLLVQQTLMKAPPLAEKEVTILRPYLPIFWMRKV